MHTCILKAKRKLGPERILRAQPHLADGPPPSRVTPRRGAEGGRMAAREHWMRGLRTASHLSSVLGHRVAMG